MKIRRLPLLFFASILAAVTSSLRVSAQSDTVTISAAEFQRRVYVTHLLTQLDKKPELDASLQVLLEVQRRNPHADPTGLADLLQQALQRYRTNAPAYIRTDGSRDEILAVYLDALRQVPARTNFVPANLILLNDFMLQPADYATASAAELIHAGNHRLLNAEAAMARREELVDLCTLRAYANGRFGEAVDALLWPETGVWRTDTPVQVLSVNSALSNSPTMQAMLARSRLSGDGSVNLSTNELKNLFAQEMAAIHEIVNTNLKAHLEILGTQTDLASYLTNTALIEANAQRENELREAVAPRLSAASAAVHQVSSLTASKLPAVGQAMGGLGRGVNLVSDAVAGLGKGWSAASKFGKVATSGNLVAGGLAIVGACLEIAGVFQDPNDVILQELNQVRNLIGDLSMNINYRFDDVDQSLNQVLEQLSYSISLIGEVGHDVDQVRQGLVAVQADLHRLERHLQSYINQLYARGLNADFNTYLGYEAVYGHPLSGAQYDATEADFFTHARLNATDGLSSPWSDRDYTAAGLYSELTESSGGTSNRLDQNLSYLKKYLNDVLGQSTDGPLPLANPRDWFVGAYAYLQLALENPLQFRRVNVSNRLDLITARGRELTNFLRSLTFRGGGTNVNWDLHTALLDNYSARLDGFLSQVQATEQQYADQHLDHFPLNTWRYWAANAPRLTAITTSLQGAVPGTLPGSSFPGGAVAVSAGYNHSLALKIDGTVVGWGADPSGKANGALAGSNVVAIESGVHHSLALKADGTVVGWGSNASGQRDPPAGLGNVVAIAAGYNHSLALKADGTVIAWGSDDHYQQPPPGSESATASVAIAAGQFYSMVLKADGTVVGRGQGFPDFPNAWNANHDFVAIAAGYEAVDSDVGNHALALRADGTVLGWGDNSWGQATGVRYGERGLVLMGGQYLRGVVAIAAGALHSLALQADGTVVGWGLNNSGQATGVASPSPYWSAPTVVRLGGQVLSDVVAVAAGGYQAEGRHGYSMALRANGTVVAWGYNGNGETTVPAELRTDAGPVPCVIFTSLNVTNGTPNLAELTSGATRVAAGDDFSVALRGDGAVVAWGLNGLDQCRVPGGLGGVVNVAAGNTHGLAIKTNNNGCVVTWGSNIRGQTNVPSAALADVVAVAAGGEHNLALKNDGTVLAWGWDVNGQANVPPGLSNVVAVAAGGQHSLALKADGTVVVWGDNAAGQTNVPAGLSPVVAIAAGERHSLALRYTGEVVAWGWNGYGQRDVPSEARSDVVAIDAHKNHNLALKADGTVLAWGCNAFGQTNLSVGLSNVVAVTAGGRHNVFLTAQPTSNSAGGLEFVVANVPTLVATHWLREVNADLLLELDKAGSLRSKAIELSGAKALLQAVLELGMPYTLQRDDVLHGAFYGTETLADLEVAQGLFAAETNKLSMAPDARPLMMGEVVWPRYDSLTWRLDQRLASLAATGQVEIPRIVGHTLRLLNLLRDAWATTPPPTLEIGRQTNASELVLYGEPYAHYTLQYRDDLTVPGWTTTSITNMDNESTITLPTSAPRRFYRSMLQVP